MQNRNPYAAPQTSVAGGDVESEEYGEVRFFALSSRIGRVRYLAYSIGLSLLVMVATGSLAALAGVAAGDPSAAIVVAAIGYVALIGIQFIPAVRRSHDMNVTGWLSLIQLVPFGALVFVFAPGTRGENNYGKRPPPNTAGVIVVACVLPLIAVVGMLAAIAIPAYQDYSIRAQVAEGLNLAAGAKVAVAETYERTGAAPADRSEAGLPGDPTDTAGPYVTSVDVVRGTVVVTYGSNANAEIADTVLAIQPYVLGKSVVWRCGAAAAPSGAVPMDPGTTMPAGADMPVKYLPSACRP